MSERNYFLPLKGGNGMMLAAHLRKPSRMMSGRNNSDSGRRLGADASANYAESPRKKLADTLPV